MEVYKTENDSFNELSRSSFEKIQTSNFNSDDFSTQINSFFLSIQGAEIDDEVLTEITALFEQLKKMIEDHIDISFIPKQILEYLFDIPNVIIEQLLMYDFEHNEMNEDKSYQIQHQFIISFLELINSFLQNSSDDICYNLSVTKYVVTLINILNKSNISFILYKTVLCFVSLFDSKPKLGSIITPEIYSHLYNCYSDINEIRKDYKSQYPPRNIYSAEDQTLSIELQKLYLKCSIIEALTNFEIYLLPLYRQVVAKNLQRSPEQLKAALSLLLDDIDKSSPLNEAQTFKIKFVFKMYKRMFAFADQIIIQSYMNTPFIESLTSFFGGPSELQLDQEILLCLQQIARLAETNGYIILNSNFVNYTPNLTDDKSLILLYCDTWYTIIANMKNKRPSRLIFAVDKGKEALKKCSNSILDITQNILEAWKGDYDFEMIKATTLIHISLIILNDNDLTKSILDRFPDICERIQCLIEAADSDYIAKIIQAIDILFTFNETRGDAQYPNLQEFFTLDLVESIEEVLESITDTEVDFTPFGIVLDKIRSKAAQAI